MHPDNIGKQFSGVVKGSNKFEVGKSGVAAPSELMSFWNPNTRTPDELPKVEGKYQVHLQEHMANHGFQGHIQLTKSSSGPTTIWDGHHRLLAAHSLGLSSIPYKVADHKDIASGVTEVECSKCGKYSY
jgi:hypothetical protein